MSIVLREPWFVGRFHDESRRRARIQTHGEGAEVFEPQNSGWFPAVDVIEDFGRFVLIADIPGVSLEAIEITTDDGVLTLTGERQAPVAQDSSSLKRFERVAGRFSRRFTLPENVNADRIEARCENGVLEISIPKIEKTKPRRIEVRH